MIVHVGGSEDRFFVFGSLFDYCGSMCADLGDCDNVQFVNTDTLIKSRALWFLYKAHNSGIANKLFRLPGRSFWYRYLFDNGRIATGGGYNYFLFFDSNPHVYDETFLQWLRVRVPNSVLALLFVNSMKQRSFRDMGYFRRNFDRMFTTDRHDCGKLGLEYVEGVHSKLSNVVARGWSDISFIGIEKGRSVQLRAIYSSLTSRGLVCDFTIVGINEAPEGIGTKLMPYREALARELSSKCILEVCSDGQDAMTQRALEAVMYDKVLITNSQAVKDFRFYDPRTMFVLDDWGQLEEIDFDTIPEPGYGYAGEFSPVRLLGRMSEDSGRV